MDEKTTNPDLKTNDDTGEVEGVDRNAARLALLDSINDKIDASRADELADVADGDKTEPFVAPELAKPDAEEDPPVKATEQEPEPQPTPEPTKFKLKVNGEEREATLEEVLSLAQKVASADDYLAEAKATKKGTAPAAVEPQVDAGPTEAELAAQRLEEERQLLKALRSENEAEAIVALRKLRPAVDPNTVARQIDERLAFTTALDWFNAEYNDLVADPYLHQLVIQRDEELVRSKDARPYRERYKSIGDDVRKWRDDLVARVAPQAQQQAPVVDAAAIATKQEQKATAPRVPTSAAVKDKPKVDDTDKEESTSDVIRKISESRGGPHWMRGLPH